MRHLANAHSVTVPAGSIYRTLFWRLAGLVALTGKAIVHWIGCINAIKVSFKGRFKHNLTLTGLPFVVLSSQSDYNSAQCPPSDGFLLKLKV